MDERISAWKLLAIVITLLMLGSPMGTITRDDKPEDIDEGSIIQNLPEGKEYNLDSLKGWFTENKGQIENSDVMYVYAASDISIGFIESGYLIKLSNEENLTSVVKVTFKGANRVVPEGKGELPHKSNYFKGNDPSNWRNEVRNYDEVTFENLYEGIDLVFYTNEKGLKYDFIVSQEADPEVITYNYEGINFLNIDDKGNILIETQSGIIFEGSPYSYQMIEGEMIEVQSEYWKDGNQIGFSISDFNKSSTLVIDPILYSTYIGGSDHEQGRCIAQDLNGNIYIGAHTSSTDFPATSGSYDESHNGDTDSFICKFNLNMTELLYATYVGGMGSDRIRGFTVDEEGNSYICGGTQSIDFPITAGCIDPVNSGGEYDGYVCKLNDDGSDLLYSTYIGGSLEDIAMSIEIDAEGNAYVAGRTYSPEFPTTLMCYDNTFNGVYDGFICKIQMNSQGPLDLVYSTFIGGILDDRIESMKIDNENTMYTVGWTGSVDFPTTPGCYDDSLNGNGDNCDAFILKLQMNNMGPQDLVYSTFIGGSENEIPDDIIIDHHKNMIITGYTESLDFPTTAGCYDETFNGGLRDIFVAKVNSVGSDLIFSTYIGGNESDYSHFLGIDSKNCVILTGETSSPDFPTSPGCYEDSFKGTWTDAIVCKFSSDGTGLLYSSYICGGKSAEYAWGLIVDNEDQVYLTGMGGQHLPLTPGCYDNFCSENKWDAYVIKMELSNRSIPSTLYEISPENQTVVIDTVIITGKGWDPNNPNTIEKVEVSINGASWILVNGTESWDFEWNTRIVVNDEYILRFRAYDGELYSDIQEVILIVDNIEENHVPAVAILSPEDNTEVSETITITGGSSDIDGNETIERVELSVDGGGWGEAAGTTSWEYEWNTTEYANGDHTLRCRAYDGIDYSDIEELVLHVQNENNIPEATINTPENETVVSGTITIKGTSSDEDGDETIEKVEISIGDDPWEKVSRITSWEYEWETTSYSNIGYKIRVRAFDGIDYSDIEDIKLYVWNGIENIPPEIIISSPLNNSEVSGEVYLNGQASDEDGRIEKVEMSIDNGVWFLIQGTSVWSYNWSIETIENGLHTIRVRSYDGEVFSSERSITVIVKNVEANDNDPWYENTSFIMGLATLIIIIVVVVISIHLRKKRHDDHYDEWSKDEDYYLD